MSLDILPGEEKRERRVSEWVSEWRMIQEVVEEAARLLAKITAVEREARERAVHLVDAERLKRVSWKPRSAAGRISLAITLAALAALYPLPSRMAARAICSLRRKWGFPVALRTVRLQLYYAEAAGLVKRLRHGRGEGAERVYFITEEGLRFLQATFFFVSYALPRS